MTKVPLEDYPVISKEKMTPLHRSMGYITQKEFLKLWRRKQREESSISQEVLSTVEQISWINESIRDLAGEYILAENFVEADQYIFRHRFGRGKSSIGLAFLDYNDLWMTNTQKQLIHDRKTYEKIHPDRDTLQIIGWNRLIAKEKDHVPQEVRELWQRESSVVGQLRQLDENNPDLETPRQIVAYWEQNNQGKNPKIIQRWKEQFRKESWEENVVFCTPKRLKMIRRRAFMPEMEYVMLDEGVDGGFLQEKWGDLDDQLARIGVKNTVKRQINTDEPEKSDVNFHTYSPEIDSLTSQQFTKLQALARKILIQIREKISEFDDIKGFGIADSVSVLCDKELVQSFDEKWKSIAKKTGYDGVTKLTRESYELKKEGKLDKMRRLERMTQVMETIFFSLNVQIEFKRQKGALDKLVTRKPMMYELWDFTDKANCEVWILDATVRKYNLNHLYRKYQRYRLNPLEIDVDWHFLGDGNEYGKVELEDESYDSLEPEDFEHIDYIHYYWDWNVKNKWGIKPTLSMNSSKKSKMMKDIVSVIEKKAENKEVGVISYKHVCDMFSDKVATVNFAKEEGTNEMKDMDEIFKIGSPPIQGMLKDYITRYRELPEYLPSNRKEMRENSEFGGLIGYRDIIEDEDLLIVRDSGTHWKHLFKSKIEDVTYDSLFRLRPSEVEAGKVHCIGLNPKNFCNQHRKTSDLLKENFSNAELVENWGSIKCKKVFKDREIVTTSGRQVKLKRSLRKWRNLRKNRSKKQIFQMNQTQLANQIGVSQSTVSRWLEGWKKLFK